MKTLLVRVILKLLSKLPKLWLETALRMNPDVALVTVLTASELLYMARQMGDDHMRDLEGKNGQIH